MAAVFFWVADPSAASIAAGGVIVLAGLLVRAWAAGVLQKNRALAVSGPYAHTRHPLYLGSFVIAVGAAIAGGRLWFGILAVSVLAAFHIGAIAREEAELARRFGGRYRRYRGTVPAFIPRLRGYRRVQGAVASPTSPAPIRPSAARYLRNREYEALIGAAAAFALLALLATT